MTYKMHKAIAVLIMTPIIIVLASAIMGTFVEEGVILQLWVSLITKIPFGNAFGELSVNIFVDVFGATYDTVKYASVLSKVTFLQVLEDCSRLLLVALCYEAVNSFVQNMLGVWKKQSGLANILMQMASSMISIVLCTVVATAITGFLYQQVVQLPNVARGIISTIVSILLIAGAYGVATLVLGATVLGTVAFVGVNMILTNALKVIASYVGMLLIIMFLNEGAYAKLFAAVSGWGVVIVLLIGIDLMMSSLFKR